MPNALAVLAVAERGAMRSRIDCTTSSPSMPSMTQTAFHHATPVYELFDGWTEDITAARRFEDLPKNAQLYIRALEEMSGAPFSSVGIGPDREQTLQLRPLL